MSLHPGQYCRWIALAVIVVAVSHAQPTAPHLGFIYPAGGQQGTTVTISVGGQHLNNATAALVSGPGINARVLGYERPLLQREINELREEADRLQQKRATARADATKPAFSANDETRAAEIRRLLATRGNRQATPALAETVTLELTVDANAAAGDRELRLMTSGGLSNPITFSIGQLPEITPPVVTSTSARPVRERARGSAATSRQSPMEITLPTMVNGQILPGEVDRFRFTARRGQRLVFAVSARALMPYLADAVPGWFQSTLAIFDSQGRELAYVDDYRFAPDPVVLCEIPAEGVYTMEIKDALFRGREDFVYRIAAGELPFVTSIFPLGGRAGNRIPVALSGWNLPRRELNIDTTDRSPGTLGLSVIQDGRLSNLMKLAVGDGPECLATSSPGTWRDAQALSLPTIVNGRIERAGAEHWFRFSGHAGETIVAEVNARRLGSPLDSVLRLLDENGRPLAMNDDAEDKGAGLLTHHADSQIVFTLPADGTYRLGIADAQRHGGADYGYRLRVGAPQPDFELRVVPSTINVRAGSTATLTVYALRRDGFSGEIALALQNAPPGFLLSGGRIPADMDSIRVTLSASPNVRNESPPLALFGRATIEGNVVAHAAVPADDRMQAFAYHHLVPAKELRACVVGRGTPLLALDRAPVVLSATDKTRIRVALPAKLPRNVTFELNEPPPGITLRSNSVRNRVAELAVTCDPAKAKPGSQGNLIVQAFVAPASSGKKSSPGAQRVPLGTVPAIPFEVAVASTRP